MQAFKDKDTYERCNREQNTRGARVEVGMRNLIGYQQGYSEGFHYEGATKVDAPDVALWRKNVRWKLEEYKKLRNKTEEDVQDVVEILVSMDFYYAREVWGVFLSPRGLQYTYKNVPEYQEVVARPKKGRFGLCDFLLRPKPHLVKAGFPDLIICLEVKKDKVDESDETNFSPDEYEEHVTKPRRKYFRQALAQAEDYNNTAFFINQAHADGEGYATSRSVALRPAVTFIFDSVCGVDKPWDTKGLTHKQGSQSQRGIGIMGLSYGWSMNLEKNTPFARTYIPSENDFRAGEYYLKVSKTNPQGRYLASSRIDFESYDENVFNSSVDPIDLWVPKGYVNKRKNKPRLRWKTE